MMLERYATYLKLVQQTTVFVLLALCVWGSLLSCSKEEENPPSKAGYHLEIPYGSVRNYSGGDGQWLNVYQANASNLTPLYIWAHGNGHTYMDAHEKYEVFVETLLANGISVISWESIKQMDESNYGAIQDDADLMFSWVKENAVTYNFDLTKVIIGGHSRGSIASWRIAQGGEAGVIGIYYGDAAGNLDDVNEAMGNVISLNSPPIRLAYNQNKMNNDGQHDPNEGQKLIDQYEGLGFAEEQRRILLDQGYPSMTTLGFYQDLLPFCQELLK